ncbi:MAG: lipoprotein-releasing ABC transporter permease subunit [Pontibacterium sp.]
MFKPLSLFVGLRYTAAKRQNHFISFISLASMLGLILGVAALIVVLSVMNGFDRELKQRILGMVPHATLHEFGRGIENWQTLTEKIDKKPDVTAAPFLEIQGMLSQNGVVRGVMVYGIDATEEAKVSILPNHMVTGSLQALEEQSFSIVLGSLLARSMGVSVGDKVTLVLPEASISVAGVVPRLKRFTVVGTFEVGAQIDSSLAYMSLTSAQKLKRYRNGEVDGVRLAYDDLFDAPAGARALALELEGVYTTRDWTQTHGNLFQAIQLEKRMVGLLLFLIVLVAAFNIVSTLVMVVTDKKSDVAIMRTFGMSSGQVMRIFMVQGCLIGLIGTVLGTGLGVLLAYTVADLVAWVEQAFGFQFLNAEVYFISELPSELNMVDVYVIAAAAMCISFLATLYPSYRATKTQPAEALRYE